jgi:alkylated DNA repair dioxygenase AlkB
MPGVQLPAGAKVHIETPTSRLWTVDNWMGSVGLSAETYMALCTTGLPLEHHPRVRIYDRDCNLRRSVGFFSDHVADGYSYIGHTHALTPELSACLDHVNIALGQAFNGCLVNYYADGNETIGAHSDDKSGLAADGTVAAISLGVPRIFRCRPRGSSGGKVDIQTAHGQLLVMEGHFQQTHTHEIPVQKRVLGARASITCRTHTTT